MCIAHGVARLFARSRGAGVQLNARQVEQKTVFGEAYLLYILRVEQGVTLHGRGKHGEAEQARCHGQRNLFDEL